MKKIVPLSILCLAAFFILSVNLTAQETTEITVQVKKDGKVVKDTTYQFEDDKKAKHAVKMMEVMSGDDEHMMKYNYSTAHSHGDESKAMVFVSKDGETTTIKEVHGDSLVWISEEELDGDKVKVIKKKIKTGEHPHGEHVMIMKKGDGDTFDILIDEDIKEGEKGKKKHIKVMVSGDEDGTWHMDGEGLEHVDEDVYVISGDDVKLELKEILEEHGDGENVKVIVVKTKGDKDCPHEIHEDCDHDHDEEVEVKVKKEKKKKVKKQ